MNEPNCKVSQRIALVPLALSITIIIIKAISFPYTLARRHDRPVSLIHIINSFNTGDKIFLLSSFSPLGQALEHPFALAMYQSVLKAGWFHLKPFLDFLAHL